MKKRLIILFMIFTNFIFAKTTVGVTMIPYFSYVSNIVGDKMNVTPLFPENVNSHSYDPTAEDMKKLDKIDIVVINGLGHDSYAEKMLASANNKSIKVINANKNVGLMNMNGSRTSNEVNSHTYISITRSIQQVNQIAKELGNLDPKNKGYYLRNAKEYNTKLRKLLLDSKRKLRGIDISKIRVATTHAGYDYLLGDFGLTVSVVIEPSVIHSPTAVDLKFGIDKIKREKINILFDESTSNHKNAKIIEKETGIYVTTLDHLTNGKYTKDHFEKFIKKNLDSVVNAVLWINKNKK